MKFKNKILLPYDLNKDAVVDLDYLQRKGVRDGLPRTTLEKIDEDGFCLDYSKLSNLNYDNSGRYFENPEESKKQIEKIISDILLNKPVKPLIIDTKGNILDGQHRACAFKILEIEDVPVFKSLMNETDYDNQSTRKVDLNIPFEKDFYTKENLNELDIYQKYKNFINEIPTKEEFITTEYIDEIIRTQKWSEHGGDLAVFMEDQSYEDDFPEEIRELASKVHGNPEGAKKISENSNFKDYLSKWLNYRYDYVLDDILEIKEFPIKVARKMYVTEREKMDIISGEKTDFGVYWGMHDVSAWGCEVLDNKELITLTALIAEKDVNWVETLRSRFDYENGDGECEIQIKSKVSPKLLSLGCSGEKDVLFSGDIKIDSFLQKKSKSITSKVQP